MNNQDQNTNSDYPYSLIDGAEGVGVETTSELEKLKMRILDESIDMEERMEAYEDIIDSEVGDTSFVRARNIEREFSLRQIYLKFEGGNPTGTQKDRIAFAQCMDALRRGFDTITLATCGNYGVATALASTLAGIKCKIFIPENYHTKRIDEITNFNAEIVRQGKDYETSVKLSKDSAKANEWYDANPGGDNLLIQLRAYGEIAYEIYDELRDAPAVVASPVSNGTLLAGIYKGFVSLYKRGKTSKIPRMVAGSSFRKNPVIQAFLLNKETCEDLNPSVIKESIVNEPLINWHSIDGDYALDAIRTTNGWAGEATDKDLTQFAKLIREREGISVLPASTAGLIALLDFHKKNNLNNDRYVVVLTGRK
jgi:threonine synthase